MKAFLSPFFMSSCCTDTPKGVARLSLRVAFGLGLAIIGVDHYLNLADFTAMTASGTGPLEGLASFWSYILPLLEFFGGLMMAFNFHAKKGAWLVGTALGSIVVGMLIKSLLDADTGLTDVMPFANNTLLWMIAFVVSASCCTACSAPMSMTADKAKKKK